jgi:hypothetical protein
VTTVTDLYDIKKLLSLLFLRSFILYFTVLPVILQYSICEKCSNASRRIELYTSDLTVYEQKQNFAQQGPKARWMLKEKLLLWKQAAHWE